MARYTNPSETFWRDRRVLITGHTGFKGSWLSLWLSLLGARVTGLALAPDTTPAMFDLADVARSTRTVFGDIRDRALVGEVVRECNPEVVLHLAAQPLVRRSYQMPVETYAVNLMGTVHLLDAVRELPALRCVLVVTSDKAYENAEDGGAREESDRLGGADPYSSSKACAELAVDAFRRSYFSFPGAPCIATARAGNVVGGGDWAADRLVPDMIRAFQAGLPAIVRNPDATRPWQHVLEPLHGYLMLCEHACADPIAFARGWNFGPRPGAVPVRQVADRLCALWGSGARWRAEPDRRAPHEARQLALDIGAANRHLDWAPRLDLDTTLELTAQWYHECARNPAAARQLAEDQIAQYLALVEVDCPVENIA